MDYFNKVGSAEKYGNIFHIYRNNDMETMRIMSFFLVVPTQVTFYFQAVYSIAKMFTFFAVTFIAIVTVKEYIFLPMKSLFTNS